MPTIQELQEERQAVVVEQRSMLDAAEGENRDLTAEERQKYDRMDSDVESLSGRIERKQALEAREAELEESRGRQTDPDRPSQDDGESRDGQAIEVEFRGQSIRFHPGTREHSRATGEYRGGFDRYLRSGQAEGRNLIAGSDEDGGYILAPMQMVSGFIREVDDAVAIRRIARTFTGVRGLGSPTITEKMNDATWTTELDTGPVDQVAKFGKRELKTNPVAKRAQLSRTLVRAATIDVEAMVRGEFSRIFAETFENAYMLGDGNRQPLGLFVQSDDGIPASRDVTLDGAPTNVTGDQRINVKHSLKEQYQSNARWVMHLDVLRNVRKLKDAEGRYIWQPGLSADIPDRILERPYILSEYAPSTFAPDSYLAIYGDFRHYWILDWHQMEIQTLVEIAARQNQVEYHARAEGDAAPVLGEAFARLKTTSS